jgi:hypothetical protein
MYGMYDIYKQVCMYSIIACMIYIHRCICMACIYIYTYRCVCIASMIYIRVQVYKYNMYDKIYMYIYIYITVRHSHGRTSDRAISSSRKPVPAQHRTNQRD